MLLTDISLKRPVFATVTILALIVVGVVSYLSLTVEEWPNVEFPNVTVVITYKGAGPDQVESKITQKVEEAVGSIAGVKHIYSTAKEGVSITSIEFTLETSPATAAQDVRDKIGQIRGDLPQDADEPVISRFDPTDAPVVSLAVTGGSSTRELTTLVNDVIKRRIETIDGVGAVNVQGSATREIQINLRKERVAAYGLTIPEIVDNLKQENLDIPAGKLTQGQREISLRTAGNIELPRAFNNVPVGRRGPVQLYVKDIGFAADGVADMTSTASLNGTPAVGLDVMKQSGANTVQLADQIKRVVAQLQTELPRDTQLTIVRDNSQRTRDAVGDVLSNLVLGSILAVVMVFLFLGNWRSTLISAIAIPTSIIATFTLMKLLNFTINTMSLLALSLAVGLLIDDAIVVIENIVRHMEGGADRVQAAREGTDEIGLAVTATTLTIVAVFVPVGMMTGVVGRFFKQFGLTVAFAVLVSLFVAFTLTPLLASRFLSASHGQPTNILGRLLTGWERGFAAVTGWYTRFLAWALHHRWLVTAVAVALFAGSLALMPQLGASFMTRADDGEVVVDAALDPGYSIAGATALADKMEQIIRATPEVVTVYSVATTDDIKIFVKMVDKRQRQRGIDAIIAQLRQQLDAIPGIKVSMLQRSALKEGKPLEISIKGESTDQLADLAEQTQQIMASIPGAVDVTSSYRPGQPEAQIQIRRAAAADLGVSTGNISDTLRTMFNGLTVGQFKDGEDSYDVTVRLDPRDRENMQNLHGIYLASRYQTPGRPPTLVPLEQVTELTYATGPVQINRYDRQREIRLSANLAGQSLGQYNRQLMQRLHDEVQLPAGYAFAATGETEFMNETFGSMGMALALAVIFIFFVLAAQFESYIDPLAIMLSLPLAIVGAVAALLVTNSELSVVSLIGIVMLMGLVTKNAILLIDFTKARRAQGMPREDALLTAARIRMRPIMMTTAAMIFGMLPLAAGVGPGAEQRAPMAIAIIGGLLTSTLLTLVVVPVIYTLFDDSRVVWHALRGKLRTVGGK